MFECRSLRFRVKIKIISVILRCHQSFSEWKKSLPSTLKVSMCHYYIMQSATYVIEYKTLHESRGRRALDRISSRLVHCFQFQHNHMSKSRITLLESANNEWFQSEIDLLKPEFRRLQHAKYLHFKFKMFLKPCTSSCLPVFSHEHLLWHPTLCSYRNNVYIYMMTSHMMLITNRSPFETNRSPWTFGVLYTLFKIISLINLYFIQRRSLMEWRGKLGHPVESCLYI